MTRKMLIIIVTLLILLNSIFIQGIFEYNSYSKTLSQVILLAFSIDFLFRIEEIKKDIAKPLFRILTIINAVFLFYFSGSLFIFMSSNYLIENSVILNKLWIINASLNLIFQIIILYAIWKIAYPRIRSSP